MFWEFFCDLCTSINKKPNTVCRELGFSSATATHWKNGSIPNGEALIKLSQYFGVSTDWLLGLADIPTNAMPEDKWKQVLNQLSEDSLEDLEKYLDFLLWKQGQDAEASE